jgi:hypothetical protein
VNGAALAACVEKVDFLFDCSVDGVKDGDSTFRAFLPDLERRHVIRNERGELSVKINAVVTSQSGSILRYRQASCRLMSG